MSKWFVYTKGPKGSTVVAVESESVALKLCYFAIATGSWFAFYAK